MALKYEVAPSDANTTIENYLIQVAKLGPRAKLKQAFASNQILLNGKAASRLVSIKTGDVIDVCSEQLFTRDQMTVAPNPALPLELLLSTDDAIVANKPAGQNVHPLLPTETDTTLNAAAARFAETAQPFNEARPLEGSLVHRIDRGTSGVICMARSPQAWNALQAVWRSRDIEKIYLAWVEGHAAFDGQVECLLYHSPKSKKRMLASTTPPKGETFWPAVTSIKALSQSSNATLVLVRIHTGVTHQIRAVLAALGHAVIGDQIYRSAPRPLDVEWQSLDGNTKNAFGSLMPHVKCSSPHPEKLPEHSFFLHALWLRSVAHESLKAGVLAPVPPYFG